MKENEFFKNKVVIITGASSGIGRAAAIEFARHQAKVVLVARNEGKLNSLGEEIRVKGGHALVIQADVSVFKDTQRAVRETILQWGQVDILISCAGKYVQDDSRTLDLQSFEDSMAVNFYGCIHVVKSVLPQMKLQKSGHISVPPISPKIKPEKVVVAIMKGIRRKKAIVVVPKLLFPIGAMNSLMPRFVDWCYRILKLEGEKTEGKSNMEKVFSAN